MQLSPRRATRAGGYRPDIQGLRGVAVLAVVLFHSGLALDAGFLGVDVFFVISGFVITLTVLRPLETQGTFDLSEFVRARFWRLAPALAIALLAVVGLSAVILSPLGAQQESFKTAIAASLGLANFWLSRSLGDYFGPTAELNPLLNTWSLSVEQQFYLAFAVCLLVVVYLLRRLPGSPLRHFGGLLAVLAVGSFALMLVSDQSLPGVPAWSLGFFSPITRAWEFCIGALIALLSRVSPSREARRHRVLIDALSLVGGIAVLVSLFFAPLGVTYPNLFTLVPVVGTGMIIYSGSRQDTLVRRLLSVGILRKAGDISYSWYLWHWPAIVFAAVLFPGSVLGTVTFVAVSLVVSIASYRWVEQPLRRRGRAKGVATRTLALSMVAAPVALAALALVSVNHGYWSPKLVALQEQVLPVHLAAANGCAGGTPSLPDPILCTWNPDAPGRPLYLIGDSNAEQFSEALVAAGEQLDRPVTILTYGGCPPFRVIVQRPDVSTSWMAGCENYVRDVLAWLDSAPPGTVVLSFSEARWTSRIERVGFSASGMTADRAEKLRILSQSIRTVTEELQGSGHQVVIVQPIPHFGGEKSWTPEACSLAATMGDACKAVVPAADFVQAQADLFQAVIRGAEASDGVVDLTPVICSGGLCETSRNGLFLYRDGDHLSVAATDVILETLTSAVK